MKFLWRFFISVRDLLFYMMEKDRGRVSWLKEENSDFRRKLSWFWKWRSNL